MNDCNVKLHLHAGYDWVATRKAIEEEAREIRRRLIKIQQLLASGQVPDEAFEQTHALLFNSVYLGLPESAEDADEKELLEIIDQELGDDAETASQSSWQSLARPSHRHQSPRDSSQSSPAKSPKVRRKKLTRSKNSRIDVCLYGLEAEFDKLNPQEEELVSRLLVQVKDLEILDNIPTSTWHHFLSDIKADSRGNVRETGSSMAKIELTMVKPSRKLDQEEARLRVRLNLPLCESLL